MLDRRHLLISAAAVAGTASIGRAAQAAADPASDPAAAKALSDAFDAIFKERLAHSPETATSLGLDKGELAGLKAQLSPATVTEDLAALDRLDRAMAMLKAIPRDKLAGMDRINYDTVMWRFTASKEGFDKFRFGGWGGASPYVLSQLTGAYRSTPDFLNSQHSIETQADAEAFLSRMDAFAGVIAQQTDRFNQDVANGVTPPDFVLDKTLAQMESLRALSGADSSMTKALAKKTAAKGIAGDWAAEAARRVDGPIAKALDAQIAAVKAARGKAVHDAGVWRLKDGDAYYAFAARIGTTTNMTPDEIHNVGLELVKQISAEADVKLKALGFSKGTVGERMRALGDDPKYIYPNTDEAKEKLIADLNVQIKVVQSKLPEWFGVLPKAAVEVRRVPKEIEAGAPGGYYNGPSLDGSRPGAYYINLRDTAEWPTWSLPTLTYHEAIPGHHLQISIQTEAKGLPMLRKAGGFSAYSEGWALYTELLAGEMGMYDHDPEGYVGYLQSSLFRAIRLVVDTGMHAKRWSREQAIAYFVATNGDKETAATTEVERYCVWPGQALSYMTGKLQWMRLRAAMKAKQGSRFDIKQFHDTGLQAGGVPLAVLEQVYKDKGLI